MMQSYTCGTNIRTENDRIADLLVVGPGRREIKYDTINLAPEMKKMDGEITECRRLVA